ncbi:MAG: Oxo-4-hydroxy-4-carboxy-5-ureidoimidazoline decarboxylase [Olpidium bornovanus]|uniref:Oxo-4-hydroxy-4-carboxy-5-ureidoimidazoline decarboxylase n=1 Tax=Olpidium bornovanus TaxID=278681 RepID=A0A8H7ZQ52_9FUNG|nr:MAG: Oxo-4-hydroxy-4-carboxy-5-ureidoimidazoline decarboxylase [Olpidium bornovanus]
MPAAAALLSIEELNALPPSEEQRFSDAVAPLFESAPALTRHLMARKPFASYPDLIAAAEDVTARALTREERLAVVNAHPAIGAPPKLLSALSYAEQGYTRNPHVDDAEITARLQELNRVYETKYGFRFVEFVNGRPKKDIIPVIEKRLRDGTVDSELEAGLAEMMKIARNRLTKFDPKEV